MIIRGPFTVEWGSNILADVEAVDIEYEQESEDYEANSGIIYEISKGIKASIRLTLLSSDIASVKAVLPQYFVATGGTLGDGGIVAGAAGAIDIKADDCNTNPVFNNLLITSCGNPKEVIKLYNARTVVDSFEVGKIRKIVVKFIGEPEVGQSIIQLLSTEQFTENLFMLGNDQLFLLGNDQNLIL